MNRFTISRHTGSTEGDHFDLMLESGEALRTWRLHHVGFESPQPARPLKDHRKKYLDYEGEVSGGRGRVQIHDTGVYSIDLWTEKLIQVSLAGSMFKTRLRLERKQGEDWTLVDATAGLRKLVSSHLRHAELDAAPTSELEALREEIAREELKLLGLVGRYSKGEEVEWTGAAIDPAVQSRLQGEWVRWRHPWLDQARAFLERLVGLAGSLREARPPAPTPS